MKIITANNRANYNYTISNKIEAGIVLTGSEVKSLRTYTGSIRGSYIIEQNGELWLSNSFIKKYQNSNDNNYDPNRNRKLLVKKKEFNKISGSIKQGGFTIVPIILYFSEKGKLSFVSETITSSRFTNWENSDNEKNKNNILRKKFNWSYD